MNRNLTHFYFAAILSAMVAMTGCDRSSSVRDEEIAQQQRLQDQTDRAALVERVRAAASAQEKKQEAINALQKQIEELDAKISDARSKGKDCRALEKAQEALETKKYELQH